MVYELELVSSYPEWWRYNIHITLVGYNQAHEKIDFALFTDHVRDVWSESPEQVPENWTGGRNRVVKCGPCSYIVAYIYAIANTLPQSRRVSDSPDFEVAVIVRGDGKEIFHNIYMVNRWGGLSIPSLKVSADKIRTIP